MKTIRIFLDCILIFLLLWVLHDTCRIRNDIRACDELIQMKPYIENVIHSNYKRMQIEFLEEGKPNEFNQ